MPRRGLPGLLRPGLERAMERMRVAPEPGPVCQVTGPSPRDERPEPRPMPEYPEMGELVDHDGLERPRRGKDEPPREHEPALPRSAPPAAARVADVDATRNDAEGRGVRVDRPRERLGGTLAEPGREHAIEGAALGPGEAHDELVPLFASASLHGRASPRQPIGPNADPVRLTPIEEQAAVTCTAARPCRVALPSVSVQVPEDPCLALDKEGLDPRLRMRPAATRLRRYGHDQPVAVVDGHAQTARTGGSAEAILDRSLAEPDASRRRIGWEDLRMSHRATS